MRQTLLLLGATGGATSACLTLAIKPGQYKAIALVRRAEKLKNLLLTQQKLDEATVDDNLTTFKATLSTSPTSSAPSSQTSRLASTSPFQA